MAAFLAVLPLFVMIALGYAAARARVFGEANVQGLVTFIYYFAIPPMLASKLAGADPEKLLAGGSFILAVFLAEALTAAIAVLWAWRRFGAAVGPRGFGIMGFSSCFSNGVFLGMPLAILAFGDAAAAPALLLVTLDILLFLAVIFLLEAGRVGGGAAAKTAAVAVLKNPVVMSTAIGLALAFASATIPPFLQRFIDFIGPAAAPTALFALGATLALKPLSRQAAAPATVLVCLKLFLLPALTALILFSWPGIDPLWRIVGVIFTAGPIGMNAYIFAAQYNAGVSLVSTAVVASTAFSVITLSALLIHFGG